MGVCDTNVKFSLIWGEFTVGCSKTESQDQLLQVKKNAMAVVYQVFLDEKCQYAFSQIIYEIGECIHDGKYYQKKKQQL